MADGAGRGVPDDSAPRGRCRHRNEDLIPQFPRDRHNLQNGGKLEVAQQMAGQESARTTGLYDRRNDSVALDEVEPVVYWTG